MVTQWFLVSLMPLSRVVESRGPLSKEQATPTAPRVRVLSGHPKDSLLLIVPTKNQLHLTSGEVKPNWVPMVIAFNPLPA